MGNLRDAAPIVIPDDAWQQTGGYIEDAEGKPDESARLLATIEINGTPMHLEAYAIKCGPRDEPEEDGVALVDADADEAVCSIIGDGGWPPMLTTIMGREYVLIATPFGD